MEVITLESNAFKHLVKRLENIEQMMLSQTKLIKQDKEALNNRQPEFISREQASAEFQISLVTVDKKIKKFEVSRQKSGSKSLLSRLEFITALTQPDPFLKVINKGKRSDQKN